MSELTALPAAWAVQSNEPLPSAAASALKQFRTHADAVAVVTRFVFVGTTALPRLISIRPEASESTARLTLQTSTPAAARPWACHLGISLTEETGDAPAYMDGQGERRAHGTVKVGDVTVELTGLEYIPAAEWAEMRQAVAL